MAMAMALQRPYEWANVVKHGYDRLLNHLHAQRQYVGIVDSPNTSRARVALFDAFHDLIVPVRFRNMAESAHELRMRENAYRYLLHETYALLEAAAHTAAKDAVRYLYAMPHVARPRDWQDEVHERDVRPWTITLNVDVVIDTPRAAVDIDLLCQEVLRRPRRAGLLELRRCL